MRNLKLLFNVPDISPVELSMDNPDGRDGETDQEVTAPPLEMGVTAVIALSLTTQRTWVIANRRRCNVIYLDSYGSCTASASIACCHGVSS